MIHPSKRDFWIVSIVLFAGFMLVGTATYHVLKRGFDHPSTWILLGTAMFYVTIILVFAYPVSYEITVSNLLVQSGLFRYRIPLSSIERVHPTRNPLSAPAWSLDRLRINYRKKGKITFALISPENKEAFLRELAQKASYLELRGDEVIRVAKSYNG